MENMKPKNYRKYYVFAILLLALIVYSCCDDGTYTINDVKVYPWNDSSRVKSNVLKERISFITELDITKHKGGRVQFVKSANATPACRGYINEVDLERAEIYTNREVYFQSNIPNETRMLIAIPAFTNLSSDNIKLNSSSF